MGEPLLNLDEVVRAARILSEPWRPGHRGQGDQHFDGGRGAGHPALAAERWPFRLVVSLTSADPERRRALMPAATPLPELMDAPPQYQAAMGRRVTLAWTMISGLNVGESTPSIGPADGRPADHAGLIDVNDASGRFQPPTPDELAAFRDALRKHVGMPVARRYSGGADIHSRVRHAGGGGRPAQAAPNRMGRQTAGTPSREAVGCWNER
jgi:23S rRNA (adenine2503-C2)-methyltransferase